MMSRYARQRPGARGSGSFLLKSRNDATAKKGEAAKRVRQEAERRWRRSANDPVEATAADTVAERLMGPLVLTVNERAQ